MTFMACAAMLASAVALNSCKSDEPNGNPNLNDGDVVKTEFAISMPDNAVGGGARKMPAATVQHEGRDQFQGLTAITLIPYAKATDIESGDARLGTANIALADINAESELKTASNAKLYENISIPMTTSSFLFYAKSKTPGTKFQTGSLTATGIEDGAPAGISFALDKVIGTKEIADITADETIGDSLIQYLNLVADATDGTKAWKLYDPSTDDAGMAAMAATYKTMHGLSSFEVARVMTDLYNSLKPLTTVGGTVQTLAVNLRAAITDAQYAVLRAGQDSKPDTIVLKSSLEGFPMNENLPSGSVRVKYVAESTNAFVPCVEGDYTTQAPLDTYVYPAQLWYFANSQIKTANVSMKDSAIYDNTHTWDDVLAKYNGATAVNSRTRSVVITDTIQYAVGRLNVTVKLSNTSLVDKAGHTISCGSGFPVTAVLVGGQKNVDFKFEPNGAKEYTIYDNVMSKTGLKATTAAPAADEFNATLVLETAAGNHASSVEKDVMIAIELQNDATSDFIGVDGAVIPKGGKFYMVAKLQSQSASQTGEKVFKQDYQTTANLTISSLKSAYNEIPDLRTPQLELGMTVDLTWKAGHVYDITIDE